MRRTDGRNNFLPVMRENLFSICAPDRRIYQRTERCTWHQGSHQNCTLKKSCFLVFLCYPWVDVLASARESSSWRNARKGTRIPSQQTHEENREARIGDDEQTGRIKVHLQCDKWAREWRVIVASVFVTDFMLAFVLDFLSVNLRQCQAKARLAS